MHWLVNMAAEKHPGMGALVPMPVPVQKMQGALERCRNPNQ
jgi:hypothetical protein